MQGPHIQLRLPGGHLRRIVAPGIIGRMPSVALPLADPRISEAHALIRICGSGLRILPLQGRVKVDGGSPDTKPLASGQRITLADDFLLEVEHVEPPRRLVAVHGLGPGPAILNASVHAIVDGPAPHLHPGYVAAARVHLWLVGDAVLVRERGHEPQQVAIPGEVSVAGYTLRFVDTPVTDMPGLDAVEPSAPDTSRTIRLHGDTVHIEALGRVRLVLGGISARILHELHRLGGGPAHWRLIADRIWPGEPDVLALTDKWQKALRRLRARARDGGLDDDLIVRDRCGSIELLVRAGDEVLVDDRRAQVDGSRRHG